MINYNTNRVIKHNCGFVFCVCQIHYSRSHVHLFYQSAVYWSSCTWLSSRAHSECVRLVSVRSRSGIATLVSLCHCGFVTWGGGVSTLWATPGVFNSDHNSSPLVTMATRSSSLAHHATLVRFRSLERNRDTLKQKSHLHYITLQVKSLYII